MGSGGETGIRNEQRQSLGLVGSLPPQGTSRSLDVPPGGSTAALLRQKQGSEWLQSTGFGSVFGETRTAFLLGLFKLVGGSEHEGSPEGQRRCVPCAAGSVWFRRSVF